MDRFQLTFISSGILLLGLVANYNYWLSRQSLKEQRVVSGIVSSLSRNQTRSRNNATHHELEIRLRANPKIFLIPVRYESAIPAIMEHVQLGDSITAYCPDYAFPSAREPVELVHLAHQGLVLLDFNKVQAASRRLAIICAVGSGVNLILLFVSYRKKELRRWWRNTVDSRRFFA